MADDYRNNATTQIILNFLSITNNSVSINGNIEVVGDRDWFKIFLKAGTNYRFSLGGTSMDDHLYLYDKNSVLLDDDDDGYDDYYGSDGNDSLINNYSPDYSGIYYLEARKHGDNSTGKYTLTANGDFNYNYNYNTTINSHHIYSTNGIDGLKIADIATLTLTGSYDTSGEAHDVIIKGTTAYIADGSAGLQVIDVTNPATPNRISGFDTSGTAFGIAVTADSYALIADGNEGLKILDVFTPSVPAAGGNCDTTGTAFDVAVTGNVALVADGDAGVQAINISNPLLPVRVGGIDTTGTAFSITINGNTAYVADGNAGLQILNVSNPSAPTLLGTYNTPTLARNVIVNNTRCSSFLKP